MVYIWYLKIKMEQKYNKMKEFITLKECSLLTQFDSFDNLNNKLCAKSKLNILSKCGHESLIQYDNFKSKGCGIYCSECINKNRSSKLSNINNNIEYDSYNIIKNLINNNFEVIKMCEGTLADLVIRPLNSNNNKWLPIQLKATQEPQVTNSNNYYFSKVNKYTNMLVICICIKDKRIWLFEGNNLKNIKCLRIGNYRSIYSSCEVNQNNLNNQLQHFYNTYELLNFENANTPISKQCINEQKYRKLRESKLPYINFEYPEQDGLSYDFIVNNLKIQEKVATYYYKRGKLCPDTYIIHISRHKTCYKKGDNNLYWFVIPNTDLFYLVPEEILIEKGYIDNNSCKLLITLYPIYTYNKLINRKISSYWINEYLFDYNLLQQDIFIKIFETGIVPKQPYKST